MDFRNKIRKQSKRRERECKHSSQFIGVKFRSEIRGLIEGTETEVHSVHTLDTWLTVLNNLDIKFDERTHILKENQKVFDIHSPIKKFYSVYNKERPYLTMTITKNYMMCHGYPPEKKKLIFKIFGRTLLKRKNEISIEHKKVSKPKLCYKNLKATTKNTKEAGLKNSSANAKDEERLQGSSVDLKDEVCVKSYSADALKSNSTLEPNLKDPISDDDMKKRIVDHIFEKCSNDHLLTIRKELETLKDDGVFNTLSTVANVTTCFLEHAFLKLK